METGECSRYVPDSSHEHGAASKQSVWSTVNTRIVDFSMATRSLKNLQIRSSMQLLLSVVAASAQSAVPM